MALLPRRGRALLKIINHTVEITLFVYLFPFAWNYFYSAIESGQTSPALSIPMYYVQAAPLFGFVLVSIRIIQRWIIEWKTVWGKE